MLFISSASFTLLAAKLAMLTGMFKTLISDWYPTSLGLNMSKSLSQITLEKYKLME
jgi:hypothetical protein